ncbi:MAG: hypothetical protein ACYC1I_11115 [Acidimicrobiales bacterium]
MARVRHATIAVALLAAGLTLSSCGTGGAVAQARISCGFVERALHLQSQSDVPGITALQREKLRADAMSELLKGTQSAANATSLDGSWNPLQTTINEAERVPLHDLIPALTRLCKVANSSTPYL